MNITQAKYATVGRFFAALLLWQTLVSQGTDAKPVAGRKSLLGGLALGGLAGAALGHVATNRMNQQQDKQNSQALPNGCQKQILREPDPHDPLKFIETERLVCPSAPNAQFVDPAHPQVQHFPQVQQQQPAPIQQQPTAPQQQPYLPMGYQYPPGYQYPQAWQPPYVPPHLVDQSSGYFGHPAGQNPALPAQTPAAPPAEPQAPEAAPPQSPPSQSAESGQSAQEAQPPQTADINDALLQIQRSNGQPETQQQQQLQAPQQAPEQAEPLPAQPAVTQTYPLPPPMLYPVLPAQQPHGQPPQHPAPHPGVVQPTTVGGTPLQPAQSSNPPQPIQPVQPAHPPQTNQPIQPQSNQPNQVIILSKKSGYFGKSSAAKVVLHTNLLLMAILTFLLIWFR